MASIPRYTHIISKTLDPVFAILIGTSAATIRIRREEKERGGSGDLTEIAGVFGERVKRWAWGSGGGETDVSEKSGEKSGV
ncbi:hypothetical protein MMC12_002479 [Toensbergia leucococca]|nr:hypothetical protein [Toensbergia leucococca]